MNKGLKPFFAVLLCSSCLFFFQNKNHDLQQSICQKYYVPLAKSLAQSEGFVLDRPNAESEYFPMWGYSMILAIPVALGMSPNIFILLVQWVLCLLGVFLCFRAFEIKPQILHIVLLIPWLALMSVKWAEALTQRALFSLMAGSVNSCIYPNDLVSPYHFQKFKGNPARGREREDRN